MSDTIILSYNTTSSTLQVDTPELDISAAETIYWAKDDSVEEITGITIANWPWTQPTTLADTTSWYVCDYNTEGSTTTYDYTISGQVNSDAKTLDPRIVDDGAG